MEERQNFEKNRNIEASILKKKGSEAQRRAASVGVRSKTVCRTKTNPARGWLSSLPSQAVSIWEFLFFRVLRCFWCFCLSQFTRSDKDVACVCLTEDSMVFMFGEITWVYGSVSMASSWPMYCWKHAAFNPRSRYNLAVRRESTRQISCMHAGALLCLCSQMFFLEVCGLQCSLVLLILAAMAHQKREREAKEIGRDLGVYQWSLGCHAHFEFLFFAWYCQMTSALCSAKTGDILKYEFGVNRN